MPLNLSSACITCRSLAAAVPLLLALPTAAADAAGTTSAPPAAAGALLLDGIAAEVGDSRITIAEVMLATRELAAARGISETGQVAQLKTLYRQAQSDLVARKLILQAYQRSGNKLQEWAVDKRIEEIIEDRFGGDRSRLLSLLNQERMSYEAWRTRIEEDLILATMRHAYVDQRVAVAPGEVRQYYATNAAAFRLPGPVRVQMIQLAAAPGEAADAVRRRGEALLARLRSGHDFGQLARQHSADSRSREGGDWGYVVPEEEFRPEIAAALARLQPGQLGTLVETSAGTFHIVRKAAEHPDLRLPLQEAWPQIEAVLRRQASQRVYGEWIDRLRHETYVREYPLPMS